MALFMSDEELQNAGGDVKAIVARAEVRISELRVELETERARSDAAAINLEQNCRVIEQKYLALATQCSRFESENSQLHAALERRAAELAQAQANLHKLELASMKQDNNVESLSFELTGAQKSKRELLELVEQKNLELQEKNGSIKAYLEKVVSLTEERGRLEGKLHETEAELIRFQAIQARLLQEKELLEQHNVWLKEEISSKVNTLLVERSKSREAEADLCSRLSEAEKVAKEVGKALDRSQERVKDLETKLYKSMEDLRFIKEDASAKEDHLTTEVNTASKLAELYKQSSEEWAKKSNELEGVIKALEVHLNQMEEDYKHKLQIEIDAREQIAKNAAMSKEKLEETLKEREAEIETMKNRNKDLHLLTWEDGGHSNLIGDNLGMEVHAGQMALPQVPYGISGTALAATLLRDGWSLVKLYGKYQEAVDALRHERQARNHSEALLERVLHEIEQKAEIILEERVEHKRMVHAYKAMEDKLHFSMSDQALLENSLKELKADFRKKERELKGAQKEILDLQTQVAVLLKECADIQQRYKVNESHHHNDGSLSAFQYPVQESSDSDAVISEKLLTFNDIHGMVEHNSQLRALVRDLALQNEQKELELKEQFDCELKKRMDEESQRLATISKRVEEQSEVIEALRGTVGMYKRLYEEESSSRRLFEVESTPNTSDGAAQELRRLLEKSQEEANRAKEAADVRITSLEEDLNNARRELHKSLSECGRADGEASFAREKLESVVKESEKQRKEMEGVLLRNMEFSQTITEYQRRLRETSQKLEAAEEQSRRLSIEVSVLEREKELLIGAEKRASKEVAVLSERAHRLQATLDTIQNVEEVRELSRMTEKKRLEDELNRMQKEWAELKHELELEKEHVRNLTLERDRAVSQATDRVEILSKELADALAAASAAETRAQISESRITELEASLRKAEDKTVVALPAGKVAEKMEVSEDDIDTEVLSALQQAQEEVQRLREDLAASNSHMEQYKSIARANEEALKEMEELHVRFKTEAAHMKQTTDMEMELLKKRLSELESQIQDKESTLTTVMQESENNKLIAVNQITELSQSLATKQASVLQAEEQIQALKKDLDKQHHDWREAQCNYERQVLLQADTIRELNSASEKLSKLEQEVVELKRRAEQAEADLMSAGVSWEAEKSSLEKEKAETDKRLKEIDEQNQLLMNRLEAKHLHLADKELRTSNEFTTEKMSLDTREEADLQNIIRYLRRAKETADTEVSLLTQERLRLQKQLEAAMRSAEEAQASLRREHEITRANLYSFEEFKNLQAQVMELNLLRESNAQLREENRRNFEDSRDAREIARTAREELEPLRKNIREKEIELESVKSELDSQNTEIHHWQTRVSQLLEKYKAIDVEEHQRVMKELSEAQDRINELEDRMKLANKESEEVKEKLSKLELNIISKDEKIADLEKRLQESGQSEASSKTELDRFKRHVAYLKRKIETLGKEKEELSKDIEELKANAGKKMAPEASKMEINMRQEVASKQEQSQKETDLLLKEKDTRIQTLEKVLEKEREELRKERAKRKEDQKYFVDVAFKANQEKKRFVEEMEGLKREKEHYFEQSQINNGKSSEQFCKAKAEERMSSYQAAVDQMLEEAIRVSPEIAAVVSSIAPAAASFSVSVPSDSVLAPMSVEATTMIGGSTSIADVSNTGISNALASANISVSMSPAISTSAIPLTTAIIPTVNTVTNVTTPLTSFIGRPPVKPLSVPTVPVLRPSTRSVTATTSSIPAPLESKEDKERAILQLRAMIQEKEKVQARKPARRIIRPRIEPSGQQDSASEGAENTFELSAEGTEADAEPLEETKAGIISESVDIAFISPSDIPISSVSEQPVIDGSTSRANVPVPRKRSASTSEQTPYVEPSEQENLLEAPQQKKPKGVEITPGVILKISSQPTEGSNLSNYIRDVQVDSGHGEDSNSVAQNKVRRRSPSPEIMYGTGTDEFSTDQRREENIKGSPAAKRFRLSTPESNVVRAEQLWKEDEEEMLHKPEILSQDKLNAGVADDTILVDETIETRFQENLVALDANNGSSPKTEVEHQIQSVQSDLPDSSVPVDVTHVPSITSDETIIELNAADTLKDLTEENSQNHHQTEKLNQESNANYVEVARLPNDQEIDAPTGGSGASTITETTIEEGEIMTATFEATMLVERTELFDDQKSKESEFEKLEPESGTGRHTQAVFDTPGKRDGPKETKDTAELAVEAGPSTSTAESSGACSTIVCEVEGDLPTKEAPSTNASHPSTSSQRGTTIHLAERARERSIVRRGGMSPPSPGARGRGRAQRGVKRASSASRGRVISTGVRIQGQPEISGGEVESATKGQAVHKIGSPPTMSANQPDPPKDEQ